MSRRGTTSRLVSRTEELGRLLGALDTAAAGDPGIALVGGDAGVGKTRLLEEFAVRARAGGATVLVGGCFEVGDYGLPYVPLVEALRAVEALTDGPRLLRATAAVRPALARLLPHLAADPGVAGGGAEGADDTDGLAQVQLFDAVHGVLVALSEHGPVVLVIEDLHWADRSTRDLLAFLARTLRSGRVMVVGSYRSDDMHRRHPLRPLLTELTRRPDVERIDLRPLRREEMGELITFLTGQPPDAFTLERVFERTEGNPFFTEEIVAAGGCLTCRDSPLPATLADILLGRVEELPAPSQQALRVASVAGRRVHHRLLASALDADPLEVEAQLREPVRRQLLVTDGDTYAFRHALLQEAVYSDLLPGERVRLHATFAGLLAASPDHRHGLAAELAHHLLASHDLPRALQALVQAAGEAESVAAPAEALRHLDQALALLDKVPDVGADRTSLLLRAAAAAAASGDPARSVALAREATQDGAASPARLAEAHERLAHFMLESDLCEDEEALLAARRAVELAPPAPPSRIRARAFAVLARVLVNRGDYDETSRWCDEAEKAAAEAGAPDVAADALATRTVIEAKGCRAGSTGLYRDAVVAAEAAGGVEVRLRAIRNLGWALYDSGDVQDALDTYAEGIALAERAGLALSSYGTEMLGQQTSVLVLDGQWDLALERAASLVGRDVVAAGWVETTAVSVLLRRGDPAAEPRLRRLRARYADDPLVGAHLRAWCAWVALAAGDEATARAEIADAERNPERWNWQGDLLLVHRVGAEIEATAALRLRGADEAAGRAAAAAAQRHADAMAELVLRLPRVNTPAGRAAVARAAAEASRGAGNADADCWRAAVEAAEFDVFEQSSSRLRLVEALLDTGERGAEAVAELRAAYDTATALGAAPLRERIVDLARRARLDSELGLPPVLDATPGLTPREVEVLRLVSDGLSNRQIGRALFISEKTASVHVSNILAKLGAASRTEAAAVARRRGLLGSAA